MTRARLMTLREAASYCGIRGRYGHRKLRRMLERRERDLKRQIMIRTGEGETKVHCRVTPGLLRRYLPNLFDGTAKLREEFSEHLSGVREELSEMRRWCEDADMRIMAVAEAVKKATRMTTDCHE